MSTGLKAAPVWLFLFCRRLIPAPPVPTELGLLVSASAGCSCASRSGCAGPQAAAALPPGGGGRLAAALPARLQQPPA